MPRVPREMQIQTTRHHHTPVGTARIQDPDVTKHWPGGDVEQQEVSVPAGGDAQGDGCFGRQSGCSLQNETHCHHTIQ